jgi:hypothetical protein
VTVPTRCQFPACQEEPRYAVTWYDIGPGRERRAVVCAQHLPHCQVLAPTRAVEEIEEEGD